MIRDRVLLVDDDRVVLRVLQAQVESLGYHCTLCNNADEAIAERASSGQPQRILICDWQMPGMSGLDLCRLVRQEPVYTYILLLTGTEGPEAKLQALDAGADAFLAKPATPADLRAHLQIGQRILALQLSLEERLSELENANLDLLKQIDLRQDAEASRDRATRQARDFEVHVAAQVQGRLLVGPPPLDPFLDIATHNEPSRQVDGDFLDFFRRDSGLDWVVGDVMGKGIPAALLGAGVKTQLLRILAESPTESLDAVITHLNQRICDDLVSLNSFVTLFYARFDLATQALSYVDGGHTKPLLYRARSKEIVCLEGPNCPLGFRTDEVYETGQVELEIGDTLVFYSDGLTEALNMEGEEWGPAGLQAAFREAVGGTAEQTMQSILGAFHSYQVSDLHSDDVSLVVVRLQQIPQTEDIHVATLECPSELACLDKIRRFIMERVLQYLPKQADDVWCYELQLAVTELASNIVRHAYVGKPGRWIQVLLSLTAQEVRVRFYHQGEPFDPAHGRPVSSGEAQEGGMGMFLVGQVTDRVVCGEQGKSHWIEFHKSVAAGPRGGLQA